MQNFFTREDVLAYHQQGVQTIRLDSMPILTDLARETLQTLGMEIVTGAAPAAQPASRPAASRPAAAPSGGGSAVGGGYGSSAFAAPSGGPVTAQKLTAPGLNKPAFRDLICSDKKLMGTFIGTPHPVMTEFVGHFGFDFVCIDAEHNAMHLETVQKMLQSLKATPTYGMVRIPTLSYENVAGALDIGADQELIKNKIKLLILDVDNTLIDYYKNLSDSVINWSKEMKGQGIKLYILSNTNDEEKVKKVAQKLDIPYKHFAMKPLKRGFKKIEKETQIQAENIAVVGDQIFTDVLGGNRSGMFTILVEPIDNKKDYWYTAWKRPIENKIKNKIKKETKEGKNKNVY